MVNVIEYKFPPDRDELELALDRVFNFVINKEKKIEIEKLVFFDLDTGQDEISNHFQEKFFKGKIDAYHILLTLDNPPLDNDHPKYARIKLFLDYLDKNQLGRKISYFDCVKNLSVLLKNLSVLLKNGKLKKPVSRSYRDAKEMFYDAVKVTFRCNNETQVEEIIKRLKHKDIDSNDPPEIFFQSNQMAGDLHHHKRLRSIEEALQEFFSTYLSSKNSKALSDKKNPAPQPDFVDIAYQNRFVALCRDIGGNLVEDVFKSNWQNGHLGSDKQFKVLIIDDNYEPFGKQIEVIENNTHLKFYQLQHNASWKDFYESLSEYNRVRAKDTANHFALFARKDKWNKEEVKRIREFPELMRFEELIKIINKTQITTMAEGSKLRNGNALSLRQFDFFMVDLQFGEQKIGDRMVRYLKRLLEDHGKRSPILILSLSDDSMDIQRCLNEGARGYIYKERIFSIPYRLKELYEEKCSPPSAAHSQNFRSLYQLPHPIIDRLKREQVKGNDGDKKWIDCLPKADLHVHLGGSMPADLIADLAFNHLLNVVYQNDTAYLDEINEVLSKIDLSNLVKYVDEKKLNEIRNTLIKIDNDLTFCKMPFPNSEIRKIAGETKPLEKYLKNLQGMLQKDKNEKAKETLKWDDILCVLLVCLAYKSGYDPSHRWGQNGFYYKLLTELVVPHLFTKENIYTFEKRKISDRTMGKAKKGYIADKYSTDKLDALSNVFRKNLKIEISGNDLVNPVFDSKKCELIKQILDARNKDHSLIGYLRGCEISGAQLLRSFENIIIAAFRIGLEASLNRIRYMELRCSPDGFVLPHTKKEIENSSLKFFISEKLDELIFDVKKPESYKEEYSVKKGRYYQVLDALLWGFGNEFQNRSIQMAFEYLGQKEKEKKNFIAPRITILISAKRHKNMGKIKDQVQMYEMYEKRFSNRIEYAPILGFDLAGAEEGYPPSVFSDVMTPLFEKCTNMTIHAGEETDWLYIWQSIYKLHATRIGHGLTLGNDLNLLLLAKEKKFCIEMCPKSNTLTNDYSKDFLKYFRENGTNYEELLETTRNDIRWHGCLRKDAYEGIKKILFPEKRSKEPPYPLRFYCDFGLPVAICTDNPCISNASMTEEYMEACRRSGGFSKWDILRIIKMGFKNAFLPKEEIARMLQRVGNEIYDKVLELEKIESPYRPSSG
jgi:adenosine deaminase/DNA-binding NarL/FixJ family response regulator